MKVEQLKYGFRFDDMLELKCIASSKEGDKRKWCAVRLVCGSGKFIDVVCTPRTIELQTNHPIVQIDRSNRHRLGGKA